MDDFKNQWDLGMALEVLQSETVDSELWASAVKWLLLYGPPGIREVLQQASTMATHHCFPSLKPVGYDENGDPCYDISELARTLEIPEEEAGARLVDMETEHHVRQLMTGKELRKLQ